MIKIRVFPTEIDAYLHRVEEEIDRMIGRTLEKVADDIVEEMKGKRKKGYKP